jgi:two-component system response regulator AtoC
VLFGHEKGAFTGAEQRSPGLFEQANGGTVFLDEVAELSPPAQAALLRVLETKRFSRVGGTEEVEVDVRVVAATHRDLEKMVEAGGFRLDLLYRLNTMVLRVPPLRERAEEIDALADLFLEEARVATGTAIRGFDAPARGLLRGYAWPGNVRELRNVIERAVLVCSGEMIGKGDLGERLARPSVLPPADQELTAPNAAAGDFKDRVQRYETDLILDALKRSSGNQTQAAKILGMPLRTLVHKMKGYGIRKLYSEGEE